MPQGRWLRGLTAVLMSGLLLLLVVSCNQQQDFNPDELFNIEDYAQDQDYAAFFIYMMDTWRISSEHAKRYLDTNVEGLTFLESIPAGWVQVDPSLRSYPWSTLFILDPNDPTHFIPAGDDDQWLNDNWYYSSFQNSFYEMASFNRDVPGTAPLNPAKVEYMRVQFVPNELTSQNVFGDSVSVEYADDFSNPSLLTGSGRFWGLGTVQAQDAPTDIASFALMANTWGGQLSNLSDSPNNPQGEFDVSGETFLLRADQLESATLKVKMTASIRSNARGEATIWVSDRKRAEIVFEYYDTAFHGYFLLRSSGFKEPVRF